MRKHSCINLKKIIFALGVYFIGIFAVIFFTSSNNVSGNEVKTTNLFDDLDDDTKEILKKSGIPVVYILTSENNSIISKKGYTPVQMKLDAKGYSEGELYEGSAYIKVRGNSTANLSKKPYKIKLETKSDLLGMGSSRHFVLLANAIDLTGVRNRILQNLSMNLGMEGMKSEPVSLVINGEYMGLYDLCEQVRIGSSRVDIYDWSELADDVSDAVIRAYIDNGWLRENDYPVKQEQLKEQLESDYFWAVDDIHRITPEYLGGEPICLSDYYDFSNVPDPTGGVLLEMDFYNDYGSNLKTAYKLPIYMSSPDRTESIFEDLAEYMMDYVQSMEYALHSTDFVFRNEDKHYKNDKEGFYDYDRGVRTGTKYKGVPYTSERFDGMHYTDLLDLDSALNNFIVCEISDNWDSMKNSFFMYKDIDSKLVFGPAWDFDWAFGNSMYGIDTAGNRNGSFAYAKEWQTTNDWFANEHYYQTQQFNRLLIRDPYFVTKLYERYHEVHDACIAPLLNQFDEETAKLENALDANYKRWLHTDSLGGLAGKSPYTQKKYTRSFIEQRITWLDDQFCSLDTLINSLGGYVGCESVWVESVEGVDEITGGKVKNTVNTPENKEKVFICAGTDDSRAEKLSFQVNGKFIYEAELNDGFATLEIPEEALAVEKGKLSVVQIRAVDKNGAYIKNLNGSENGVFTNAESCYVAFTVGVGNTSEASASENRDSLNKISTEETDKEDTSVNKSGIALCVLISALSIFAAGAFVFLKKQMQ